MEANLLRLIDIYLEIFFQRKNSQPNGFRVEIFIHFMDLMAGDLLLPPEESQVKYNIFGSLNSTFIYLISKVSKAKHFMDYRPISLCNIVFKMVSKIFSK